MKVSSESKVMVRRKDGASDTQVLAIQLDAIAGLPRQARGSRLRAHDTAGITLYRDYLYRNLYVMSIL